MMLSTILATLLLSASSNNAQLMGEQASASDRVDNCHVTVGNETLVITHGNYQYIAGKAYQRDAVWAHCDNGALSCHDDDGKADSPVTDGHECDFEEVSNRARRLGTADLDTAEWADNTMCIQVSNQFTTQQNGFIQDAIAEYDTKTGIQIITTDECNALDGNNKPCGNCQNYAQLIKDQGCYSLLGYQNAPGQPISLVDECFFNGAGTVIHEFGHALGLFHEHTHPLRETIVLRNGISVPPSNYQITDTQAIRVTTYDEDSIMHYPLGGGLCVPEAEFADTVFCDIDQDERDGCVVPEERHCDRDTMNVNIGQRSALSDGDVSTLTQMYTGAGARRRKLLRQ